MRLVMILMGCNPKMRAIYTSVFSFGIGQFDELDIALLVCRIESPPRMCLKMCAVFRFCVWALLLVVMAMTDCHARQHGICKSLFIFCFQALYDMNILFLVASIFSKKLFVCVHRFF